MDLLGLRLVPSLPGVCDSAMAIFSLCVCVGGERVQRLLSLRGGGALPLREGQICCLAFSAGCQLSKRHISPRRGKCHQLGFSKHVSPA